MVTTKLFKNGGNQAIRIPKRWSFESDAVTLIRQGDSLIIRPKKDDWSELEDLAAAFERDFMREEVQPLTPDPPVKFE